MQNKVCYDDTLSSVVLDTFTCNLTSTFFFFFFFPFYMYDINIEEHKTFDISYSTVPKVYVIVFLVSKQICVGICIATRRHGVTLELNN